jgi:NRPS condensation-like uncharacterized protein
MTAYIRALYQHFGRIVALPCAVDLRKYLPDRKAGSICNLVTNLKCYIGASFACTLEKVKITFYSELVKTMQKHEIGSILHSSHGIQDVWIFQSDGKAVDPFFSNPTIALTNLGILDKGKLKFGKTEMTGAFTTRPIKYVPYFQIAVSTFDNVMALNANLYGTQADRNKISSFMVAVIAELCGTI